MKTLKPLAVFIAAYGMFPCIEACLVLVVFCCVAVSGQNAPANPSTLPATSTVRIWVSPKQVNSMHGELSSAALLTELNKKCVGVALTDTQEKADYRLEAGYAWCCTPQGQSRGFQFTMFNRDGDAIYSTKTHGFGNAFGNAVKDTCKAIGHEKPK